MTEKRMALIIITITIIVIIVYSLISLIKPNSFIQKKIKYEKTKKEKSRQTLSEL